MVPQIAAAATTPASTPIVEAFVLSQPGQPNLYVGAANSSGGSAALPADGSVLTSGAWATTSQGDHNTVQITGGSLFGGEITFDQLTAADGSSQITNLHVLGTAVSPQPGDTLPLADWGTLTFGGAHATVAITIEISATHAGLAAGSQIEIGEIVPADPPATTPPPTSTPPAVPPVAPPTSTGGGTHVTAPEHGPAAPPPPKSPSHRPKRHLTTHPKTLPHEAGKRIVAWAVSQIGWPYVWGGESEAEGGFDCSGLVDFAYASAGFTLPGRPTADVLLQMSQAISQSQLRAGDLVFLLSPTGYAYHVGLYAGNGDVIVASHHGAPVAREPLADGGWQAFGRIFTSGSLQPAPVLAHVDELEASAAPQRPAPAGTLMSAKAASAQVTVVVAGPSLVAHRPKPPRAPHRQPHHVSVWGEPRLARLGMLPQPTSTG